MNDWQEKVREFMLRAEQSCPDKPTVPSMEVAQLRHRLIREELHEYWVNVDALYAFKPGDLLPQVADSFADLLYVVIGAAVAWGIDIEPVFDEVHRANMTKFIDGERRYDGKWLKGPSWTPPDIESILRKQMD